MNSSKFALSSDLNNGSTNITFNRFLSNNSTPTASDFNRSFALNPVLSSEDEQQVNRTANLLQLLSLERKRKFTPKKRTITRPQPALVCLGIKGKNVRKKKRLENANLITNPYIHKFINDDEIYKELDIYHFVPKSISSFELLMNDRDNMKIWNDFISLSDDEQEEIINDIDNQQIKKKYKHSNKSSKQDSPSSAGRSSKHPIHNAKKCFDRIDSCLKSVLRRKCVSLSFIDSIENDLILHFKDLKEDPKLVFHISLDSSFERLCLHALCQFHGLNCQSYDKKDGRWSRISSKDDYFEPSIVSLTSHLEKMYLASANN